MRAAHEMEPGARALPLEVASDATVTILRIPLPILTREGALDRVERAAVGDEPGLVLYVNAHTLNLAATEASYADVLLGSTLLLNDGVGVSLAARLARRPLVANLNGSDFNPLILERAASRGWKVFFVGGRTGIAATAAAKLTEAIPGLNVVGTSPGYLDRESSAAVAGEVRRSGAELLMVGMGSPLQELWLNDHLEGSGARLGIGVGGFFDFASGATPRAPHWMNRAGLEWSYRLAVEPRRLWRRYILGNPRFLARIIALRIRGS